MRTISPWNSGRAHRLRGARGHLAIEAMEPRLLLSSATPPANIALTSDPGVQQMPSIAADPLDPRHLVVSYMDRSLVNTGYAGIGVAVSHNGGNTWARQAITLPAGFSQGAANPKTVFDGQGHVFVSFMAATFLGAQPPITNPDFTTRTDGFQANNGIFIARSDDGGTHWGTPAAVASHLYTGTAVDFDATPDLVIDTFATLPNGAPNPRYGEMYETWTRIYAPGDYPSGPLKAGGTDIMIAVSTDGGNVWQLRLTTDPIYGANVTVIQDAQLSATAGTAPPGLGYFDQSHLTVGPDGDLYEACFDGGDFAIFHSVDDAMSFVGPDHVADRYLAFGTGFSSALGVSSLPGDQFRTYTVRDIAADPVRPGTLYAVENIAPLNPSSGGGIDPSDIFFARSTDYGQTWQRTFRLGSVAGAQALNDDNGGQLATQAGTDEVSGQVMPHLAVNAQGDVTVIWYDTRHDPAGVKLDVFGTVSTDGGESFSPNFRVTSVSFDPNAGAFTDPTGQADYYLGDSLGLAATGVTAIAAWTDTRQGDQNVEFASYPLSPALPPPNDRFEPNDSAAQATDLGTVVTMHVPRLALPSNDTDWFRVAVRATGTLTVGASPDDPALPLQLDIWDASGSVKLASNANGPGAADATAAASVASGQTYLVEVNRPAGATSTAADEQYTLDIQALTADLGTVVYDTRAGSLGAGASLFYLATAAAAGSLQIDATPATGFSGTLDIELLDPNTLSVLAGGTQAGNGASQASLAVDQGQRLLVHVFGDQPADLGAFELRTENLDQFTSPLAASILLPDAAGPSQVAVADMNGDGADDLVVSNVAANTVSVYLGNKDGTFQAARQCDVGAFVRSVYVQGVPNYGRGLAVEDFNHDGIPDIAVSNYGSSDVSVLLGRGDGTFSPQRRLDATPTPMAVASADLNGDGNPDLLALDAPTSSVNGQLVTLLGRGDGTFAPAIPLQVPGVGSFSPGALAVGDFNHDGIPDVAIAGLSLDPAVRVYLGNGDGTFRPSQSLVAGGDTVAIAEGDINGDGNPDLIVTTYNFGQVAVYLGNGDGTFQPPEFFFSGAVPTGVVLADVGSQITMPDGSTAVGPPDGHPDLILSNSGAFVPSQNEGPAGVVVLYSLFDDQGNFQGFSAATTIAAARTPAGLATGDFNGDGVPDVAVADTTGIRVIFGHDGTSGSPPPALSAGPRNLGTVVHLLEPTLTITPDHAVADYSLEMPVEAVSGSGDEVLDVTGAFQDQSGGGLELALFDANTNAVLATGSHLRVQVSQGQSLDLRVLGQDANAAGAYTLDIDVLPQLVSAEAPPLLPAAGGGGAASTLVLTFQGDRLDPVAAQDPANYTVTWLGPDGKPGTADDRIIPLRSGSQSVVYDPDAAIGVTEGTAYPDAVRQTVTLTFAAPLAAGSYLIRVSPAVGAAAFSDAEASLLAEGHPLVTLAGNSAIAGGVLMARQLVAPGRGAGSTAAWSAGTPFLAQMHDDLSVLLDAALTARADDPDASQVLIDQILQRFIPALTPAQAAGGGIGPVVVVWLDPVSIDLEDRRPSGSGGAVTYQLGAGAVASTIPDAFVSVAGNIELLVLPAGQNSGSITLTLSSVHATSRGGAVVLSDGSGRPTVAVSLTSQMRAGVRTFDLLGLSSAEEGTSSIVEPAVIFDLAGHIDPSANSAGAAAFDNGSSVQPSSVDELNDSGGAAPRSINAASAMIAAAAVSPSPLEAAVSPPLDGAARAAEQFGEIIRRFRSEMEEFMRLLLGGTPEATPAAPEGGNPAPGTSSGPDDGTPKKGTGSDSPPARPLKQDAANPQRTDVTPQAPEAEPKGRTNRAAADGGIGLAICLLGRDRVLSGRAGASNGARRKRRATGGRGHEH